MKILSISWYRGLAVPAARNVDDPDVIKGKELFEQIGCAYCHRPSWTTGDDNFYDPNGFFTKGDSRLPRYPNQTIWPYSDLVQHKLHMENDIRYGDEDCIRCVPVRPQPTVCTITAHETSSKPLCGMEMLKVMHE